MMKFATVRRCAIALLLVLASALSAAAIAAVNPVLGYSFDLPIGWSDAGSSDPYLIGFLSPGGDAMLQIIALDGSTAEDGAGIAGFMKDEIDAEGDVAPFTYQSRSAALADVTFVTSGNEVRGYMVTIDGSDTDYVLLAFSLLETYETNHDQLLSSIDSFSIGEESRLYPGPISQFYYAFPPPSSRSEDLSFLGDVVRFEADPGEFDATQVVVEREARILAPYGSYEREVFESAWRRFFRMIYRDNYQRLGPLAETIADTLSGMGALRVEYPRKILAWLQGFRFERAGGLSDFRPPIWCLDSGSGDCDSLAMTYVILLHHLRFDAIIMVSDRYSHALAAVDVSGNGARFSFEGRDWLVAELTDQVAMGQIAADMADPSGWIGVRLRLKPVQ